MSAHPIDKVIDQMNRKNTPEASKPDEKVTYDKLASLLGVSKQTVINWKADSSKMPLDKILELEKISGVPVQDLMKDDEAEIPGPVVQELYESKVSSIKKKLSIAKRDLGRFENISVPAKECTPFNSIKGKTVSDLQNIIETTRTLVRKPRICALGQSDSGKSTLANYLLHEKIVPASYTPMTSAISGLHYIDDRPDFLTGADDAVVYGRKVINGKVQGEPVAYDDYQVTDKDKIICIGDHKSILNAYGTREGAYFGSEDICIDSIHIFMDNPLLKEVDYYDVPGFGSGEASDDVSLTKKMYQSDIIFYLSQADAFLKGSDLSVLSNILAFHGKDGFGLRTVYVMATHANAVGGPIVIDRILNNGMDRLVKTMTDTQLENLGISRESFQELRKRCFAFDISNHHYCHTFNEDFETLVPFCVEKKISAADHQLRCASKSYEYAYSKAIQNIDKDLSIEEKRYEEIEEQKKKATNRIRKLKESLFSSIKIHNEACISNLKSTYNDIVDEDNIVEELEYRDVKNKKDEINDFATYLSNKINDGITSTMRIHSEKFKDEINKSISDYSALWNDAAGVDEIDLDMNGFDFTRAFAAGLSGVTAYGALALWASTVAAGSNLGAYILVAKIVSALSAIGISVGGTAAAVSAISTIGGPVVLGVALALIAAISVWGILTGTWRKRVAKKIIKAFEEANVYGKCTSQIDEYWDNTKTALESCLQSLNDETIKEYDTQNELRATEDKNALKEALTQLYTKLIIVYGNLSA